MAAMKIYLLRIATIDDDSAIDFSALPEGFSLYSDDHGHVVIAETERQARDTAAAGRYPGDNYAWWRDPNLTTCVEIFADGLPRIVMSDSPSG